MKWRAVGEGGFFGSQGSGGNAAQGGIQNSPAPLGSLPLGAAPGNGQTNKIPVTIQTDDPTLDAILRNISYSAFIDIMELRL